jgi:hypothetical protein
MQVWLFNFMPHYISRRFYILPSACNVAVDPESSLQFMARIHRL